jgi:hypothetical protein
MKNLRLIWNGPALVRLKTLVGDAPKDSLLAMHTTAAFSLILASLVLITTPKAFAQETTFADAFTPLVYSAENTGANLPTPNFPPFAQLPIIRPLPDPFLFNDGFRRPWFHDWERRRNEIMASVEKYEIGPKPDCHDCTITATYTPPAAGSSTGSLVVNVTRNGMTLTLTSGVFIPQGMGNSPFPALIPMEIASFSFGGPTFNFPPPPQPDYGSLPASVFTGLPIATVGYVSTQVAGLTFGEENHTGDPFYLLYPELCAGLGCTGTSNSGTYAAWSWGVSRLIDGMEIATHQATNPLPIDMKHLGVTGCSFAGKMALFAGALDERIALTIAQENGGGGAPAYRISHEIEAQGTVEDVDDESLDWFGGQLEQFAGANVYKLPTDHHELMALIAPRALLETGNTEFYYLSNGSNYISARATQKIFNTLGIGDRFGFYIDGNHAHCGTLPAESAPITAFVNKFMLGQASTNTDVEVFPNPADTVDYGYPIVVGGGNYAYFFPAIDYKRWTDWWETGIPEFPNDWNTGGTVVASLSNFPLPFGLGSFDFGLFGPQVNSGDTVAAGYDLTLGGNHPAATVSTVSGANINADIVCLGGTSYTVTIPLPAQSYSIAAGDNSPQPTGNPFSPLVFQGSTTATPPAGASCVGGRVTHAFFSATGVSVGGIGNPGGPGILTSDVTDPLDLRFHLLDSSNGQGTFYSFPLTVDFDPLTSANSTNQNPVAQP